MFIGWELICVIRSSIPSIASLTKQINARKFYMLFIYLFFWQSLSVSIWTRDTVDALRRCMGSRQPALMEYLHSDPRHHAVGVVLRLQWALGPLGGCLLKMQMLIPYLCFPGCVVVKNLPANVGEKCLIPGSGRSPGEGNGSPLKYSCLGNPTDRGAWWATVHGVTESQAQLSDWAHTQSHTYRINLRMRVWSYSVRNSHR